MTRETFPRSQVRIGSYLYQSGAFLHHLPWPWPFSRSQLALSLSILLSCGPLCEWISEKQEKAGAHPCEEKSAPPFWFSVMVNLAPSSPAAVIPAGVRLALLSSLGAPIMGTRGAPPVTQQDPWGCTPSPRMPAVPPSFP